MGLFFLLLGEALAFLGLNFHRLIYKVFHAFSFFAYMRISVVIRWGEF